MRYCHHCDAQFPDDEKRCLHCNAPLHDHRLSEASLDADAGSSEDVVLLASLDPFESRRLLDRLAEAGVDFTVLNDQEARARSSGRGRSYAGVNVFVPVAEHARASALQQQMVRESLPDLPPDFEPDAAGSDVCPACSAPLAGDAQSCGECGLEFPEASG